MVLWLYKLSIYFSKEYRSIYGWNTFDVWDLLLNISEKKNKNG